MRNNDLIATAVCAQYTPEQLHKLAVSRLIAQIGISLL